MDALIRLPANLAIDSRTVRYGPARRKRASQLIDARKIGPKEPFPL
jgi:hypothetical protein